MSAREFRIDLFVAMWGLLLALFCGLYVGPFGAWLAGWALGFAWTLAAAIWPLLDRDPS